MRSPRAAAASAANRLVDGVCSSLQKRIRTDLRGSSPARTRAISRLAAVPTALSWAPGELIQLMESLCDTSWIISPGFSHPRRVAWMLAASWNGSAGSGAAYQWCRGFAVSQRNACTRYVTVSTSYPASRAAHAGSRRSPRGCFCSPRAGCGSPYERGGGCCRGGKRSRRSRSAETRDSRSRMIMGGASGAGFPSWRGLCPAGRRPAAGSRAAWAGSRGDRTRGRS